MFDHQHLSISQVDYLSAYVEQVGNTEVFHVAANVVRAGMARDM